MVGWLVGWLAGWLMGWLVGLQGCLNSNLRVLWQNVLCSYLPRSTHSHPVPHASQTLVNPHLPHQCPSQIVKTYIGAKGLPGAR